MAMCGSNNIDTWEAFSSSLVGGNGCFVIIIRWQQLSSTPMATNSDDEDTDRNGKTLSWRQGLRCSMLAIVIAQPKIVGDCGLDDGKKIKIDIAANVMVGVYRSQILRNRCQSPDIKPAI